MYSKTLLFAGTTEGRFLSEYFINRKINVDVCVATEYGEVVLPKSCYLTILVGRKSDEEIVQLLIENGYEHVIDATHPYATLVTTNIRKACKMANVSYERVIRETADPIEAILVSSIKEAVEYLNTRTEVALITTGSKEVIPYCEVENYKKRLYFRVLPTREALQQLAEIEVPTKQIIGMQGPFSEELNYAMLTQLQAKILVTKESGTIGGFEEKQRAAKRAGAALVVIMRPEEEKGITIEEWLHCQNGGAKQE